MHKNQSKRKNYISWDDYFMAIALLSAQRSKDPYTQVGACIISPEKKIVGVGYNGFPKGCSDNKLPWNRSGSFLNTKYAYVCHAELNAILNSNCSLDNCVIYTVLFPCNECTKLIIQAGICKVIFLINKYDKTDSILASKRMLDQANIPYTRLIPKHRRLQIDLINSEFND